MFMMFQFIIEDTEGRVDYVTRIDMQGIKSCPWLALSSLIHESWLLSQKSINTNTKVCNYGGEGPCLICIEKIQSEVFGNTSFYLFCIGLCWKSNSKTNTWVSRKSEIKLSHSSSMTVEEIPLCAEVTMLQKWTQHQNHQITIAKIILTSVIIKTSWLTITNRWSCDQRMDSGYLWRGDASDVQ